VKPDRIYSVRAQVTVGRRLIFVSDTLNPVLTQGAPDEVSVWMIKVGDTTPPTLETPAIGAHGLRLPATFAGELPCSDCEAERIQINLWPDQVFHLRRAWKGTDHRRDSIGRWSVDADRHVLKLRGGGEQLELKIAGPDRLQLLAADSEGETVEYPLTAGKEFQPFDPHLPLRGMLTYVADEARFTECLTGRDYPLIKDGDYAALEHAYLAAGAEVGGPIMASFDGAIVREPDGGPKDVGPKVLVERFVGVWPGETCERAMDKASLTNTYWKILRLGDAEVAPGEGRREPNMILREGEPQFTATVGCNQFSGTYELTGDKLSLGPAAVTKMACPAPLDDWEKRLADVLSRTSAWRIDGQTLELLDADSQPLALLQAVYLY
jgi:copper homeostasis protein (lipoprotein)